MEEKNKDLDLEQEDGLVVLIDDEGNEQQFELVDAIELENEKYAILAPIIDEDIADEVMILKIGQDENGEDILFDIEDDEEWERVAEAWQELIENEE